MFRLRERARAGGIHMALGVIVAAAMGVLVFGVWYPHPYREVSGGRELFLLVLGVDLVLGPLTTLLIYDTRKSPSVLARDVGTIVLLQVAGLAYGVWTMAVARPVHLVFEVDRFHVVHAVDVPEELLPSTPPGINPKPWTGPDVLASNRPAAHEVLAVTLMELQGVPLAVRPHLWRPYEQARAEVLRAAKPIATLKVRFPGQGRMIDDVLAKRGRSEASTLYVPMRTRNSFWTALIDAQSAALVGFVPLDPF